MLNPPEWARYSHYAALVYFKAGPRTGGMPFYSRELSFGKEVRNPEKLALDRLVKMIEGWYDRITTAEIYDMKNGQQMLHKFCNGQWVQ